MEKTSALKMDIVMCLLILVVLDPRAVSGEICQDPVCEFHLDIRRVRSMTYQSPETGVTYNVGLNGSDLSILANSFRIEANDPVIGEKVDGSDVITTDGHVRDIIVINDQFPGPNLEVMEGAQVAVHVTNHLLTDGATIHWHGLLMEGTPWMDGVPYITQCPILPRQSFTYRFKAVPVGTHWYHSHFTNQRMDGLFGMLVIHNHLPPNPEFLLTLMDWWQPEAEDLMITNPYGITHKGTGEYHKHEHNKRYTFDNTEITTMTYYSTLINGRGRQGDHPLPLEEFTVQTGQTYRFRMIHSGAEYSYVISVDGHQLRMLASDGGEISPIIVDSFMMHPSETMDFELLANQEPGLYWVRAKTLGVGVGRKPVPDDVIEEGKAILRYGGVSTEDPTTNPKTCTELSPCVVFNCPFAGFSDSHHTRCLSVADARSTLGEAQLAKQYGLDDNNVEEHFFNFNFAIGSNINGRKFSVPRAPLYQDYGNYIKECDSAACAEGGCVCTNIKHIPANKTLQFVATNFSPGIQFHAHHNVHLHGHNFAVLKMGYPDYNRTTGFGSIENTDIACEEKICASPRWNGQSPELNLQNPPIKDTVIVPGGGYTVFRFRTENPGMWMFHCHQELHFMEGMAMVIAEGATEQPPPPAHFSQCRDFEWSARDHKEYMQGRYGDEKPCGDVTPNPDEPKSKEKDGDVDDDDGDADDDKITMETSVFIGVAMGFVCLGAVISVIPLVCYLIFLRKEKP